MQRESVCNQEDKMMAMQTLYSAKRIEQQFHTGEEPVMVMCSDVNIYVCKYMRSSATAYKLACELIGAKLAKAWRLTTPDIALVKYTAEPTRCVFEDSEVATLEFTLGAGGTGIPGDANGDGNVTVTDIGVIVDIILGKVNQNARKFKNTLEPE